MSDLQDIFTDLASFSLANEILNSDVISSSNSNNYNANNDIVIDIFGQKSFTIYLCIGFVLLNCAFIFYYCNYIYSQKKQSDLDKTNNNIDHIL